MALFVLRLPETRSENLIVKVRQPGHKGMNFMGGNTMIDKAEKVKHFLIFFNLSK
jgi:hypothetical protein